LLCLASDVTFYSSARAQRPNRSLARSLTHTHSHKGMEVTLLRLASQAFRSSTGERFTVNVCSTTRTPSVSTGRSQRQHRLLVWLTAVSRQAAVRWDGRHFNRLQCCGCKLQSFFFFLLFTFTFYFLLFSAFCHSCSLSPKRILTRCHPSEYSLGVTQANTHSVSELTLGLFCGYCLKEYRAIYIFVARILKIALLNI
jgi:hypothetical protein